MLLNPKHINCIRKTIELNITDYDEADTLIKASLVNDDILFGLDVYKLVTADRYKNGKQTIYTFVLESTEWPNRIDPTGLFSTT